MLTVILIIAITLVLLQLIEQERQRRAKHRAATASLLNHIQNMDVARSFRLEANAAGTRWEN